jgi:hypothetical protein
MSSKKFLGVAAIAVAAAVVALGATLPAASTRAPAAGKAEYLPVQSINHELGSKAASGYFVTHNGACAVTLMVSERSDPDAPRALTAARVRLLLQPGQVAGLDSEEGRALHLTCGPGGATLSAETGERGRLMARQQLVQQPAAAALR